MAGRPLYRHCVLKVGLDQRTAVRTVQNLFQADNVKCSKDDQEYEPIHASGNALDGAHQAILVTLVAYENRAQRKQDANRTAKEQKHRSPLYGGKEIAQVDDSRRT